MPNIFDSIQLPNVNSNIFNLSHDKKMSLNFGGLYPVCLLECIPGDKFDIEPQSIVRMAPMVAPVMHRINQTIHYFFVPYRILWDDWQKWIVQDPDAGEFPYVNVSSTTGAYTKLHDYLGLPTPIMAGPAEKVSAMPQAAYQAIYQEYYRDQNLIADVDFELVSGDNSSNADLKVLRTRAWEHDYFTSALPFAQKGPAVNIPLLNGDITLKDGNHYQALKDANAPHPPYPGASFGTIFSAPTTGYIEDSAGGPTALVWDPEPYQVDVQATTINDLRSAIALQQWLERNARGGTRYIESILAHFGVRSSDARLQRPEYITGIKTPVVLSEVLNTTGEDGGLPQGNMAGHGISVTSGRKGHYYCEEHGVIIGVMSIMPMTAYFQGIPKLFLKTEDPFQYAWPEFAHLGEQEVLNREVYAYTLDGSSTFGYVPRYAEYKFMQSCVAGDFRTNLLYWHLARKFDTAPSLNADFVNCVPRYDIFAVEDTDVDHFYAHVYNQVFVNRKLPKFGTPGLIKL